MAEYAKRLGIPETPESPPDGEHAVFFVQKLSELAPDEPQPDEN